MVKVLDSNENRNESEEYFLARLRNRIVDLDYEPLIENKEIIVESKFRDINHLEDLLLAEGPRGLERAISILRSFAGGNGHSQTSIKWDGSPSVAFGRLNNGEFFLTDKHGYSAKTYNGKATSAKELGKVLSNRKPTMDENRQKFVRNMMTAFNEFKQATPKDFRGILVGDIMYFNTPKDLTFKPNVVEYKVNPDSKIGKRIANSNIGIVIHNYVGDKYKSIEDAASHIKSNSILVMPPTYIQQPSSINTKPIDKVESYAKSHADEIKSLFNPANLKGIANIHTLMYRYINNKVDVGLDDIGSDFDSWLDTQKLSNNKKNNILNYIKEHSRGVNALWNIIMGIMKIKDHLINEFDSHPSDIQQSINGKPGGEGYVVKHPGGLVKLVSRDKFTRANRQAHR